jgi:predicted alpha/beta superfamily hydrolase
VLFAAHAWAQELVAPESLPQGFILVVDDVTRTATEAEPIYFAGTINGWNPMDPRFQLTPRSDQRWQLILDRPAGGERIEFKFTMGGWAREELDGQGRKIQNRTLPLIDASRLGENERPVIELSVPEFRVPDEDGEPRHAWSPYDPLQGATGDIRRLQVQGGAGRASGMQRDLLVWLPPGYDDAANAGRSYPVLYLMDGQNVFSAPPGLPAEWSVDETAQRLVEAGRVEPLIIVAVPHAGMYRGDEYLPFGRVPGMQPHGAEFVSWLRSEVMPRVERAFRVRAGAASTGIGGASLGGAISLYASAEHPDVFGRVLIESLPLLSDGGEAPRAYVDAIGRWPERVYVGMGAEETGSSPRDERRNAQYRAWAEDLGRRLEKAGLGDDRRLVVIGAGQHHTEGAWAQRFPAALEFLFPAE